MRLKNLFLGVSLVSVAVTAQAQYLNQQACDYFSGPYIRAGALYQSTNDKYTIDTSIISKELGNTDLYIGRDTWGGDLGLGYGRLMDQAYYIGAEVYAKATVGKQKLASIGNDNYLAMKTPFAFGAMAKLGYSMTPNSLIYVGLGAERSQFRLTEKITKDAVDLETRHKWGFVPSLGMDLAINCNWQVGARLSYANYSSIGLKSAVGESVGSINPRRATFDLNLTYHFV